MASKKKQQLNERKVCQKIKQTKQYPVKTVEAMWNLWHNFTIIHIKHKKKICKYNINPQLSTSKQMQKKTYSFDINRPELKSFCNHKT